MTILPPFLVRRSARLALWLGALVAVMTSPAVQAAQRANQPRYAAFMVDAGTREVLYANAPDDPHHPASLTKMMTLYLVFDALEAGRLHIGDPVFVSRHAASQKPSRLGLAVGQSISVDNAISVVAVKSANDIAVALAEKLGGTEPNFAAMMNAKAAELGMRNTHFANASGLTDPTNVTTARDLAILGLALIRDHPRFYRYFGEKNFAWERSNLINHNHLLGRMVGMDGIKTGYTVDAGFTLAASAVRGNRRLIAIILGEPSLVARSRDATALLEAGFSAMDRRMLGQSVTVASMLPTLDHPALRVEPAVEQGSSDDNDRPAPPPVRARAAAPAHHESRHARREASRHEKRGRHESASRHESSRSKSHESKRTAKHESGKHETAKGKKTSHKKR